MNLSRRSLLQAFSATALAATLPVTDSSIAFAENRLVSFLAGWTDVRQQRQLDRAGIAGDSFV